FELCGIQVLGQQMSCGGFTEILLHCNSDDILL
ncbi:hypothetical protein SOVF_215770, partial [Spinacia oleracea]